MPEERIRLGKDQSHAVYVNIKDNEGQTYVDCTQESSHTEIVELLGKHGAKE